jgi:hypothetical protein
MKTKKSKHTVLKIFILLLVVCAVIIADSRFRIVTTDYTVSSERLPASFDGYKIVQLSDIHGTQFGAENARLVKKVEAEDPDVIAITGDLADSKTDMAVIDTLLGKLAEIAPVYYVSGNHEWASHCLPELEQIFEKHGIVYLKNEYILLERNGESIVLSGVEDPNGWQDMPTPEEVADKIKNEQGDKFTLLLGHRNYWAEIYPDLPVDLILCGHAHGGIVRLPFVGGVIGAGYTFFPDHVDGASQVGEYTMIVSRGLGNSVRLPRFLNNPEIVAVTLRAQ